MQTGGACFVGCLKKIQRFFYKDTFQIVISIYKCIVRIFFRKIYGRKINGINQGVTLSEKLTTTTTRRPTTTTDDGRIGIRKAPLPFGWRS